MRRERRYRIAFWRGWRARAGTAPCRLRRPAVALRPDAPEFVPWHLQRSPYDLWVEGTQEATLAARREAKRQRQAEATEVQLEAAREVQRRDVQSVQSAHRPWHRLRNDDGTTVAGREPAQAEAAARREALRQQQADAPGVEAEAEVAARREASWRQQAETAARREALWRSGVTQTNAALEEQVRAALARCARLRKAAQAEVAAKREALRQQQAEASEVQLEVELEEQERASTVHPVRSSPEGGAAGRSVRGAAGDCAAPSIQCADGRNAAPSIQCAVASEGQPEAGLVAQVRAGDNDGAVLHALRQLSGEHDGDGVTLKALRLRLAPELDEAAVRDAMGRLIEDGEAYETIDECHFLPLDGCLRDADPWAGCLRE